MTQASTDAILIVEDDAALRKALGEHLTSQGFVVRIAENGVTGLATALAERPRLIILDLRLPALSGDEVLHKLRGAGEPQPYVIVLTNDERMLTVSKTMDDGVTDYLVKADVTLARVVELVRARLQAADSGHAHA